MKKAVSNFSRYAADNRSWLICLLCCYGIDRATTYICLLNRWFGEANPLALTLWGALGHSGTEVLTILLLALVFFYIGALGKQYLKDYILPAFCIVYCILMLGNLAAISLGALGLLRYGRIIDISRNIDYNLFVLILILGVLAVLFVLRGRSLRRREAAAEQPSNSALSGSPEVF
jgi:hypothetical protein